MQLQTPAIHSGWMKAPKMLIPKTCGCYLVRKKGGEGFSADVIMIKILREGDCPGLHRWTLSPESALRKDTQETCREAAVTAETVI